MNRPCYIDVPEYIDKSGKLKIKKSAGYIALLSSKKKLDVIGLYNELFSILNYTIKKQHKFKMHTVPHKKETEINIEPTLITIKNINTLSSLNHLYILIKSLKAQSEYVFTSYIQSKESIDTNRKENSIITGIQNQISDIIENDVLALTKNK